MLKKISILFFTLMISYLNGQTPCGITLKGKILDGHEQAGLEYASIYLPDINRFAYSDKNGEWVIDGLCPGAYHLNIDHLGCESKKLFLTITKDTLIQIKLEHHTELLSVVDVMDQRYSSSVGKANYEVTGKFLSKSASQSLAEVAKLIPGVDAVRSGSNISKPLIHGLSGNRVAIMNDGIVIEGQQWGMDHSPEVDVSNAGSVKVLKGSAAILYGSMATAGVVISESDINVSSDPHLHGKFRYNFQSNGLGNHLALNLSKKTGDWHQYLGAAIKRSGDMQTPNYYLRNTGLSEQSLDYIAQRIRDKSSIKYTFKLYRFNAGILRSAHIGNLTDLKTAITREIPFFTEEKFKYTINAPKQSVNHATFNVNYQKTLSPSKNFYLKYTTQINNRKEFDVRRAERTGIPVVDMLLTANHLETLYEHKINHSLKYLFGSALRVNVNYNIPGTGSLTLLPDYRLFNPNLFGIITKKIKNHTQIEGGLRYENHQYFVERFVNRTLTKNSSNFHSLNANFGIGSRIKDIITVKADLSYVSRPPQINELYSNGVHQGLVAFELGNTSMTNENSLKSVIDVGLDLHDYGHFSFAFFAHRIDNFIYLLPRREPILTIRGAFFAFDYTNSDTWLRGFEGIYKVNLAHSSELLLSGGITRSFNRDTKEEILWTPPPFLKTQFSQDLYISKSKNQELNFSIGLEHTFENQFVSASQDLLPPPPGYTLVNADITYKQSISKRPIQLTLSFRNLLNETYRNYLNRFRYFADEPGRSIDVTLLYNF